MQPGMKRLPITKKSRRKNRYLSGNGKVTGQHKYKNNENIHFQSDLAPLFLSSSEGFIHSFFFFFKKKKGGQERKGRRGCAYGSKFLVQSKLHKSWTILQS